ncbi:MAG: NADH:ubiquinone reductase (Na(+)-transporting) subunit B [Bacteroidales bacterium]|nr:NADH:ubiquinone reductase (Na(+)-transporting) subunit B [Bacteroidales bacterium]MCF8344606.1 NADH:ubiquinone reductase (Na(+)-transporting) subunit B [Bacteroidales bacterium]MCF8352513.1 NADH:ubiquinone reductase (Na(+)-transporting) subunit B [Bacteroidales bacterium]MCF8375512.1 NADH:ubiquinone reductase (Na(+)-transporting) subunit B [Bacteroidales bacterium]MCF8399911.1 NADH:ubiquinone reductase (Na(+)-transporting) subunit B [Bacteroidales bacterium]
MKGLRKFIDKIKPQFEKGGRFEKLHSTFEAFETFLFVPNTVTKKGSHIRDAMDMKRTMAIVVLAMVPPLLFGIWNVGYQHYLANAMQPDFWPMVWYGFLKVFPIIVVSYVTGLAIEFAFAQSRGHEVNEGFLVSGMLIPLVMPPDVPLWMVAVATAFAVIIGKEVFGGTGMNILNPALTARAFLFFAYPRHMSGDDVWIAGMPDQLPDGVTGATPLGEALAGKTEGMAHIMEPGYVWDMFWGGIPGSIGETSVIAILLGAIVLLITGIGSWRIMLSVLVGSISMGLIFNAIGATPYMQVPFWQHLIMGGFAFGLVYMATDPVTASQTQRGKYIYGFLIGFIAILIRVFNPGYPEGMMLAILLMNVFAPLIDYYVLEGNIKKRLKRVNHAVESAK